MDIHFDQGFGLSATQTGFRDGMTVNLDESDDVRLPLGNQVKQAIEAYPCRDRLLFTFSDQIVVQFVLSGTINPAQLINPAITRNGRKPGQERPRCIVTCPFGMK